MTATAYAAADEIEAAILRELELTGAEKLVSWTNLMRRVPGTWWEKQAAHMRLWHECRIFVMKIGGSPYCSLADEVDREIAEKFRREGRVREVRHC